MQLHELQPIHKPKSSKRIGRGGKRGTYSGRGVKGQNSRAGTRKRPPTVQDIFKRYHKLRGYQFKPVGEKVLIVNIKDLEVNFKDGDTITSKILIDNKIVSARKGTSPVVKILGLGKLTKKFNIQNCKVSKTAEEKIKKLGGLIK